MLYLNEKHLHQIGVNWEKTIKVIEDTVYCLSCQDFAQPIKPYLRYRDLQNRIIAMPAFVGGNVNKAGIKWIASFPENIKKGLSRAHSVIILNNANTGEPEAIINTALASVIRTASVSGLIMKHFHQARPLKNFNIGIIGWGPIGQYHYKMCTEVFGDTLANIFLYDVKGISQSSVENVRQYKVIVTKNWEDAYHDADVFITCTVAKVPYVNKQPKHGSLQLNVSLRDYTTDIYEWIKDSIIVDSWEEACREGTDVERMHKEKGLKKEATKSITDVVVGHCMQKYQKTTPIMFNPMGMAVFDIAIGTYYLKEAYKKRIGRLIPNRD